VEENPFETKARNRQLHKVSNQSGPNLTRTFGFLENQAFGVVKKVLNGQKYPRDQPSMKIKETNWTKSQQLLRRVKRRPNRFHLEIKAYLKR